MFFPSTSWSSKANQLGLFIVLGLAFFIGVLFILAYRGPVYEQPILSLVLQVIFVLAIGLIIAFISAKSYLQTGSVNLLLIGDAILISSIASTVAAITLSPLLTPLLTSNEATAIADIGLLFSSLVLLLSAVLTYIGISSIMATNRKVVLATTFFISLLLVLIISLAADFARLPAFITSSGPTPIRIVVLSISSLFYFSSALLFGLRFSKAKSQILYWYCLGLILFALALIAGVLTWQLGDVMNWASRISFYLSNIYFLFAVLSSQPKTPSQGYVDRWADAFRTDRTQVASLFANMLESFIYCKIITDNGGKPVDWIFLDVNASYERLTGLKRENIINRKVTEIFPNEPNDPSDWIGIYGKVALTGVPATFESFRQTLGKWLAVSAYSPRKRYFVSIFQNITERKKTEDALKEAQIKLQEYATSLERLVEERTQKIKEAEQSYRELYESFGEAFIATDWEFTIIHWNKAAEKVAVVSAKDALGKKIYDVLPEMLSVNITPYFEALREKKSARFMMNAISRETGRPSIFEISTYPSNLGIIIIVEDKTEEEETKRLSAVGQTAGMVGHDIRNPLQAIIGSLYLLQSDIDQITSKETKQSATETIREINENIDYINKIVADLQDYARKTKPSLADVNLKDIVDLAFSTITVPRNIAVECRVESDIRLKADPSYMRRIITNLSVNAIQAMPKGGKLTVEATHKNHFVEVVVTDTGEGIPQELQNKLFKPLFTTKAKGQGFGLAVVRKFVEELGGSIIFESKEGKGTKFIISLPINHSKE